MASFHSKYFMATEGQFTSNKHTNILGGLETCHPVTPCSSLQQHSFHPVPLPGLRVVTQFRHTASHLGPQAPNYSTALAVWFMFIYIYINIYIYKRGNLFLSESSKQPAAVRADQGQWQPADKVSQQHMWLWSLPLRHPARQTLPAALCPTHHLSSQRCFCNLKVQN